MHTLDMYGGLSKVLDLVQSVLKEGSVYYDFKGREECRSFVLEKSGKSGTGEDKLSTMNFNQFVAVLLLSGTMEVLQE